MALADTAFHSNSVSVPRHFRGAGDAPGGGGAVFAYRGGGVTVSGNSEFVGNFVKELYIDLRGTGGALSLWISFLSVTGPVEHPNPYTLNPEPQTLKPKPQTLKPYNLEQNS